MARSAHLPCKIIRISNVFAWRMRLLICGLWVRFPPGSPTLTAFGLVDPGRLQPRGSGLRPRQRGRFPPGSPSTRSTTYEGAAFSVKKNLRVVQDAQSAGCAFDSHSGSPHMPLRSAEELSRKCSTPAGTLRSSDRMVSARVRIGGAQPSLSAAVALDRRRRLAADTWKLSAVFQKGEGTPRHRWSRSRTDDRLKCAATLESA